MKEIDVAAEFNQAIVLSFAEVGEVHAETVISAAAVAIAWSTQQCAVFVDPAIGYAIAVRGIMEGCKTVPMN